ncbi:TetR/AcrR family transcriptional regulator [Demequina mangrovi]|uniref:Transcriptional regulator, TetR family n=1 Tax=Demequina mangrovi TaxID=1043493 RepID=A0A1H6W110_9MICO|nr:TetR/AcrR family transcriptional regulator [Demequina mangrovi]SEJ10593.1 transcriptional regulator, TetR family [Demequina mangrovi]
MARPASDKRARLTAAAATLAYTHGLDRTTLGAIAEEADVPQGSVYYYFKTRDDVGRAVVDSLLTRYRDLMSGWDAEPDPRTRLASYVDMYARDAEAVAQHGCPIGSLCLDLRKSAHPLADDAAAILELTIAWASEQFEAMGFAPQASRARALHLVTGLQGAASLANALGDREALVNEAAHLTRWIHQSQAA